MKYIRAAFIMLSTYFLMKVVIFLGISMNKTGIVPESVSTETQYLALRTAVSNAAFVFLIVISYMIVELLYYRKKRTFHEAISINASIVLSLLYFVLFSFLNFLMIVNFISRDMSALLMYSVILNTLPILGIYEILFKRNTSKKAHIIFWISAFMLSLLVVIPYGSFISYIFYTYLL
ncbi:MAG: hypothetical protein A4E71_00073 [Smithella sp. PtaU1.Bin162]|nr:MAG: hypothetical protein A4E71_00073 [Smithella sp. PtaU1.Bin162]